MPFILRPDETRRDVQVNVPQLAASRKDNILLLSLRHQHVPSAREPGMNFIQEPLLLKLPQVGKVQAGIL